MISKKGELFRIIMFFSVVLLSFVFSFNFSNWGGYFSKSNAYSLHSLFDEIGNVRIGSPVKISGVMVGSVNKISLNEDYQAEIYFLVDNKLKIPEDSSIKIVTQGILGGNYLAITPGVESVYLQNNDAIEHSQSAFIMENFINKALAEYSSKGK